MLADEIAAALSEEAGVTAAESGRAARRAGAVRVLRSGWPPTAGSGAIVARLSGGGRGSRPGKIPPRSRGQVSSPRSGRPPPWVSIPWQAEALAAWERRGGRGVVEAVTGAGKTMVGVAAALDELWRRGQVLVLVPTVELQHQWAAGPRVSPDRPDGGSGVWAPVPAILWSPTTCWWPWSTAPAPPTCAPSARAACSSRTSVTVTAARSTNSPLTLDFAAGWD